MHVASEPVMYCTRIVHIYPTAMVPYREFINLNIYLGIYCTIHHMYVHV